MSKKIIAVPKYPFTACVIGMGNKPDGGVTVSILKEMENSLREFEKMVDAKELEDLKDSLRISKQTFSAKYINRIFGLTFNKDKEIVKKAEYWYKKLLNQCQSEETYKEVIEIVKDAFSDSGFKFIKKDYIFGGIPVLIFFKSNQYFYIQCHKSELYFLFRKGGKHKFELYANDDMNEESYDTYNVSGGIANLIKFCNGLKIASKFNRIASKVCLAYTKKDLLAFLKKKLGEDEKWALRALQRIYEGQTYEELNEENTKELNGLGFTGFDAPILTSIYKSYLEHNKRLTPKQMQVVMKMMGKYAGQIYRSEYLNKAQLEKIYAKYLEENLF